MARYLGIDLGSSSVRAALIDDDTQLLGEGRRNLTDPSASGRPRARDPDAWTLAVRELLEELGPVEALAIGGQMNGYVAVDSAGQDLGVALTWQDRQLIEAERGLQSQAAPPVAKFAEFLIAERPEIWSQTVHLLLPKDYVLLHLTGEVVSDHLSWNSVVEPATGQSRGVLSAEIGGRVPPTEAMTAVHESAAARIVLGCPDSVAAFLGGGLDFSRAFAVAGTSETIAAQATNNQTTAGIRVAVPIGDQWLHVGSSSTGGLTLNWAAAALGLGNPASLLALARDADRAEAPFFLPYLSGERAPVWNSSLTASWQGLRGQHAPADLAYAVVESITFARKRLLDAILASTEAATEVVRASGGMLRDRFALELCARSFQRPVEFVAGETGALGAAIVALAGDSGRDLLETAALLRPAVATVTPGEDAVLEERFQSWMQLQ